MSASFPLSAAEYIPAIGVETMSAIQDHLRAVRK